MDKNKIFLYILYGVLIVVLGYAIYATQGFGLWKSSSSSKSSSKMQAVFLSNGQVYFGELKSLNSQFMVLKDIYYLRVDKPIQPKPEDANQQGKLSLVKLGNEVHGPQDEMKINRDHVVFVENLKDDGQVMKAIQKYKDQGPSATEPASTTSPSIEE